MHENNDHLVLAGAFLWVTLKSPNLYILQTLSHASIKKYLKKFILLFIWLSYFLQLIKGRKFIMLGPHNYTLLVIKISLVLREKHLHHLSRMLFSQLSNWAIHTLFFLGLAYRITVTNCFCLDIDFWTTKSLKKILKQTHSSWWSSSSFCPKTFLLSYAFTTRLFLQIENKPILKDNKKKWQLMDTEISKS